MQRGGAYAEPEMSSQEDRSRMNAPAKTADVCISIVMTVSRASREVLDESINSVLRQSNPAWELCICGAGSSARTAECTTAELLGAYRGIDPRIRIAGDANDGAAATASNQAAELSTGNFVAFLDEGDMLDEDAVDVVAQAAGGNPEADIFYTDEDEVAADGLLSAPHLKPDWSPEHLLSAMYIGHLLVVRKSLFLSLDGLRPEYDGAEIYDLALRATAQARQVVHIPRVLYHGRKDRGPGPVARAEPARRALADFVRSQAPAAEVVDGLCPGAFRVKWPIDMTRPVTLIVLTDSRRRDVEGRGDILLVEHTVNSILERSSFRNFRIFVLDNGALPGDVHERFAAAGVVVGQYRFIGPFSFSRKINYAFGLADTEDVIVLNDDIEVIAPDWIEAMLAFSQRREVGVVGARLQFANDRLQHAGVVLGLVAPASHVFYDQPGGQIGYQGFTHVIRNYSAVTGAVFATRMSIVHEIGGFDANMPIDYNDIDFCLRVQAAGYRVVYTPFASLYHFERSTIVRSCANPADEAYFVARWRDRIACDPYYNPGLPRDRVDYRVERW
jgi:O-antigen biosynthesis protein